MRRKGFMVVFEGLDGSGKATQFRLFRKFLEKENAKGKATQIKLFKKELENIYSKNEQFDMFSDYLKELNRPFVTYDFPQYYSSFWGAEVGHMLDKKYGTQIDPHLKVLPYILDQASASMNIKKNLKLGKIVLCNRYVTSNMIFQPALIKGIKAQDEYLLWLDRAAYKELGCVREDRVIAFYIPVYESQKLIEKKTRRGYLKKGKKDLNEENIQLQNNTAKVLLRIVKKYKHWSLINCMDGKRLKTPDEISKEVISVLKPYLS